MIQALSQIAPHGCRQRPALQGVIDAVERSSDLGVVVVVGSFATGEIDELSDVDLLVVAHEGAFPHAWRERHELRATGSLVAWDDYSEGEQVGAHKWVRPDLVLVECLLSAPGGGARLAEPFAVLGGDPHLVDALPRRAPIDRSEMTAHCLHPVELAYDRLKEGIRRSARGNP